MLTLGAPWGFSYALNSSRLPLLSVVRRCKRRGAHCNTLLTNTFLNIQRDKKLCHEASIIIMETFSMWKRLISRGITSLCTKGVFTLGNLYCTLACLTPKVQLVGPCDCCVLCLGLTKCNVPYIQRLALRTVQLDYGTYWCSVISSNTQAFKISYGFIAWVVCLGPLQCWKMKQLSMRCSP